MKMISIAIADDNNRLRSDLSNRLSEFPEVLILHQAVNGADIVEWIAENGPVEAVLMDIEMPVLNGIEATMRIKAMYPEIRIVMVTIHDSDDHIFEAILAGADSYLLKDTSAQKIFETIQDTLAGGAVMSPSIAHKTLRLFATKLSSKPQVATPSVHLSSREKVILELISAGRTNKAIADQLLISPFTVKRHVENIYKKLQSNNRIELIDMARKAGLL